MFSLFLLPKIFGAIGLLLITIGVVTKREIKQDKLFIAGSVGLLIYSISLKDPIFIPLQIVFIIVTSWELFKIKKLKDRP